MTREWELVVSDDLSGSWIQRDYGDFYVSIQLEQRLDYSITIAPLSGDIDSCVHLGPFTGLELAKECAESIALQWEMDRHAKALEAF